MTDEPLELACRNVDVAGVRSHEYEFAATATATVAGPDGTIRIRRRYEGLPFHNDVVDPGAVDSNDELVDRPNEIHVHSKVYAADDGAERYLFDRHETWTPRNPAVLRDEASFLDASRGHHLTRLSEAYARAGDERIGQSE